MRRILLGLLIGLLIFGAGFAGAKIANVTNPMQTSLDANGFDVINADSVTFTNGTAVGADAKVPALLGVSATGLLLDTGRGLFRILTGSDDPTAAPCVPANPGSLYLRGWLDASGANRGQFWTKTGSGDCDWTQAA